MKVRLTVDIEYSKKISRNNLGTAFSAVVAGLEHGDVLTIGDSKPTHIRTQLDVVDFIFSEAPVKESTLKSGTFLPPEETFGEMPVLMFFKRADVSVRLINTLENWRESSGDILVKDLLVMSTEDLRKRHMPGSVREEIVTTLSKVGLSMAG